FRRHATRLFGDPEAPASGGRRVRRADRHPAGAGLDLFLRPERHPARGLLPAQGKGEAESHRLGGAEARRRAPRARHHRGPMGEDYNRRGRILMSANPEAAKDETIVLRDAFVPHGRKVPFENGWTWIAQAWSIFRRAPGVWIGVTLAGLAIYVLFLLWILYGPLGPVALIAAFLLLPIFA